MKTHTDQAGTTIYCLSEECNQIPYYGVVRKEGDLFKAFSALASNADKLGSFTTLDEALQAVRTNKETWQKKNTQKNS